ncbi:hypothetical protein EV210_101230 [Anaerospora hongkongensis]|uniref:Uncharacterized protein n=1 Tax=Anaerospora hongkongensis TaxID=244830 RepID=A0A4R1Q263_9FIRM|nr:hypothetical protein [Anaerospora hongkongensis]TCL40030.1 hypothetical protein EV210_101230 [Anaerospora hongkongensis]
MALFERVESMVTAMKEVFEETKAMSIGINHKKEIEIHLTNGMFARIIGTDFDIVDFSAGKHPFKATQRLGGANWFTLIDREQLKHGLTLEDQHKIVRKYINSLIPKEKAAPVGAEAVSNTAYQNNVSTYVTTEVEAGQQCKMI